MLLVGSVHFTPALQSVFYPWSVVCILPLVCSLYFTPGLQSALYPWSAVYIIIYINSTFYIYIQQYAFSFNFNPSNFYSTKILVQLQPKITSFNKNNNSTSANNNFIQQQYLFNNICSTSTQNVFIQQI